MVNKFSLEKDAFLSDRVASFLAAMNLARKKLLETINDIDDEILDFTPDNLKVETIGTLLLHIAAVEWSWIFEDIDKKEMDYEKWKFAFPLREDVNIPQLKGKDKSYFLNILNEVRNESHSRLKKIEDGNLEEFIEVNNQRFTIEWILYHIIEHEILHIGQILLLKRLYMLEKGK